MRTSTLGLTFATFKLVACGEMLPHITTSREKAASIADIQEPQLSRFTCTTPERAERVCRVQSCLQFLLSCLPGKKPSIGTGELREVEALWFPHVGVDGAVKYKRDKTV